MKPNKLFSVGCLAQMLQTDVDDVRSAFAGLGIKPALFINNVEHYTAADVRRLRNHFQKGAPMENAKTRRLAAENRETKNFVGNVQAANRYLRKIDALMRSGHSRAQAVRIAGRENPSGQKAFLLATNHAPARDLLTARQKIVRR